VDSYGRWDGQATLSQNLDSLKVHVDALDDKVKAVPPQKNPTPA
jgi:hypothetical protein